jgi:iron complex outermembrane receptor protein
VLSGGTPGRAELSLRGITSLGGGAAIGTYIDDSPIGSSGGWARASSFSLDLLPYDIERVEVLRGPQGTLYGASTVGGLLKYVSRQPDLIEQEIRAGAELSSVEGADDLGWGARVGANLPLIAGKLAVRASYFEQRQPGFIDNVASGVEDENDVEQDGGRIAMLWQASEALSLRLSAMRQKTNADNSAAMGLDPVTLAPYGDLRTSRQLPEAFDKELRYYSGVLNWNLGWADFVAASSYEETNTYYLLDVTQQFSSVIDLFTEGAVPDGLAPFPLTLDFEKFTQEVRLASPTGGRWEWLVGAFYTDEDSFNSQIVQARNGDGTPVAGLDPLADGQLLTTYREYAGFGDVTYRFTDRFDVSAGVRWAKNKQTFRQLSTGALIGDTDVPGASSENVTTYMFSPRFHVSDATMVYARIASGYRPGGPNLGLPGVPPQVDADTLINYELGVKTELAERRGLIDLSVFYIDWSDIQVSAAQGGISYQANGGEAQSKGVELTTVFSPAPGVRLGFNAAYIEATLAEDAPSLLGRSGDRLPGVPEWNASFTADYEFGVGSSNWSGRVGGGYRYVGDRYSLVQSDPQTFRDPAYDVVDLNATLFDERWTVALFVKNLLDDRERINTFAIYDAVSGDRSRVDAIILQPRTIGMSIEARF